MNRRLLYLMLALFGWPPLSRAATTEIKSRLENSLRAARSISRVEIEWLDTLWITDPQTLQAMRVSEGTFTRVVRYSYVASGPKYRLSCQLVSGTGTNLSRHRDAAFDGTTFYHYTADSRYLTKSQDATRAETAEGQSNPLLAPFIFLTRQSDECINCGLRFTELASLKAPQELGLPKGQGGTGGVEISVIGLPIGEQPTTWNLELNGPGDSFKPRTITRITPGWRSQTVNQLLNYTNLGGYLFPTRIEWIQSSYPPTSPPTLSATGTVTVLSARIPSEVPAEGLFTLEEEAKLANTIWDWDRVAPEVAKAKAELASKPKIYDESADGTRQLADALARAKAEHKHVLLQFGANWCGWCHKLHKLFETDRGIAKELKADFVVVMVDVNEGHNKDVDAKYDHPTRFGLPAIVVLDADGKRLTTKDTAELGEGDHHSPEKVLAFLSEWAPKK